MKRVELLIEEVRELTGNQRYDANSGVSQYLMVRSLKNAQTELFKQIVNAQTKMFSKASDTPCVSGQSLYSYPFDIYLMNIDTMQWAPTATSGKTSLYQCYTKDQVINQNAYPYGYILRGDGFILSPPISMGSLYFTYIKRIPDLEKRSGIISAVTTVAGAITAMTLNIAETSFDSVYLNKLQSLCVVDKYGVSKVLNVDFTSVDATTGVVTLGSSHTLLTSESVAVGDYVTAGRWTYNTSELPDICEAHIIKHSVYERTYGDASKWTKEAVNDMALSLNSILDSLKKPSRDIKQIPITNTDYLDIW